MLQNKMASAGTNRDKRKTISPAENVSKQRKKSSKKPSAHQYSDIKDLILSTAKKNETINAVCVKWKEGIRENMPARNPAIAKNTNPPSDTNGHSGKAAYKSPNPELYGDCPIRSKGDMTAWFKEALRDDDIRSLLRSSLDPDNQIEKNSEKIENLEHEVSRLTLELDELQQYGRRNALRIHNPGWKERNDENTDEMVLKLIHENLGIHDFPLWLISRSHRVGPKRDDGTPRPVIVKFISYRAREQVYKARRSLPQGVHINEDLTQATARLAYQARQLRRNGQIEDTWTYDGRVFIKPSTRSRGKVVRSLEDLLEKLQDPGDSDDEGPPLQHAARTNLKSTRAPTQGRASATATTPAPAPARAPTPASILAHQVDLGDAASATPRSSNHKTVTRRLAPKVSSTTQSVNSASTPKDAQRKQSVKSGNHENTTSTPITETIDPDAQDISSVNETMNDDSAMSDLLCTQNNYSQDNRKSDVQSPQGMDIFEDITKD